MYMLFGLVLVWWGQMLRCTTAQECIHGEMRTVTNRGNEFIQYCVRGEWRLHCAGGGLWRAKEADVACRQLGYAARIGPGGPRASNPGAANTTNFFRFAAQCTGTENSVQECGGDVQELDSCSNQYGIAQCQPADCTDQDIRLVNGSTNREGRVEVCVNGRWVTVCNKGSRLAGAVCAHLGFSQCGATLDTFPPSTPPRFTCTVQSGSGSLQCTPGSCDLSPGLGVVCRSYKELLEPPFTELINCETNSEQSQLTRELSVLLQQCIDNSTDTKTIFQNNITTTNTELQQSRATINTLEANITVVYTALGAVIGLLVVVLMIAVIGWIVTCVKLVRELRSPPQGKTNPANRADKSCDETYATVGNIENNPAYKLFKRDQGEENTYEVIDH